jgi:hypothetical protein
MSVQAQFRASLLDASAQPPAGLQDGAGQPASTRYNIYRNNVVVALRDALHSNFPILAKLLGAETFLKLADDYLHQHPPTSPLIMYYGCEMPAFLDDFAPLKHIGYLPDIAALELALRQSYHAKDAAPLDAAALTTADLAQTTLTFAPATCLIQSDWPLYDVWRFNTDVDAPAPRAIAQSVLITRAEFDPEPHPLTPAQYAWAMSIQHGQTLGTAQEHALNIDSAFDLTPLLTLLLTNNALSTTPIKGSRP